MPQRPPVTPSAAPRPASRQRGGRRPGAGAPKANANGLKHGLYSPRFRLAALMVAVVPELRLLFSALDNEHDRAQRRRYMGAITEAYRLTLLDPELDRSIKSLLRDHVRKALSQIRTRDAALLKFFLQSSNQSADNEFVPLMDAIDQQQKLTAEARQEPTAEE